MLKIGDKLMCKVSNNKSIIGFNYGKYYSIEHISKIDGESFVNYKICNDKGFSYNFYNLRGYYSIHKFFYTTKEIRRMKLEKISN